MKDMNRFLIASQDFIVGELWSGGSKPEDIVNAVSSCPLPTSMHQSLRQIAANPAHRIAVLSDANTVFIASILQVNILEHKIVANLA